MKTNKFFRGSRFIAIAMFGMFGLITGFYASAYDFSVKNKSNVDIYYNINPDGQSVTVTYGVDKYKQPHIEIPETVSYDGKDYTVTAIGQKAFEETSVSEITFPNTITEFQGYAFYNNKVLKTFNYPANLKYIRKSALKYTNITNGNLPEGLEVIENEAFYGADMETLYLPKSLKTLGEAAFGRCYYLTELTIPGNIKTVSKSAFSECKKLQKVIIENGVESLGVGPSGGSVFSGCPLTDIKFPSSLSYIGPNCFSGNKFVEITLPDNIKAIGNACFSSSSELESITFSAGMEDIPNYVCENCPKLIKVVIPEGIKYIGQLPFKGASLLSHVTLPETVTELGVGTFGYSGIVDFSFPSNLTYVGSQMFENCSNLTEITIPKTIKEIKNSAFTHCDNLRKVNLPETLESIKNNAFSYCSSLEEINLPGSIKIVSEGIFHDCTGLREITIPEGITKIEPYALEGCKNLSELKLPKSLQYLSDRSISACDVLRKLTIYHQIETIEQGAFNGCPQLEEIHLYRAVLPKTPIPAGWLINRPVIAEGNNCTLYVPDGSVKSYMESEAWNTFKEIKGMEITEAINYQISIPYSVSHGKILVNGEVVNGGPIEFEMGSDISISTEANNGYHLDALYINGEDVTSNMDNGVYLIENLNSNVAIDAQFAENPLTMSLFIATGGSIDVDVEKNSTFSCVVSPEDGWKVHSVIFNGQDITSSLSEDMRLTTPIISSDSELHVVFESDNGNIEEIESAYSDIKVGINNNGLVSISGVAAGATISVYDINGMLTDRAESDNDITTIQLSAKGIYLIKIGHISYKVQY